MKQIEEGLFLVEEAMPCFPKDIIVGEYELPDTLGRVEQEEAAARVLHFSQEVDDWVGVSLGRLAEMIIVEHKTFQEILRAQLLNESEERRVRREVRRYYMLCVATLGVYATSCLNRRRIF
jgi:hypothetical protein